MRLWEEGQNDYVMIYAEARPVTLGLFIKMKSSIPVFFFSHTLPFEFFFSSFKHKWDWIKTSTSPPPSRYGISDPNPQIPCLFSSPGSMLRPTQLRCALQHQLAHDDAHNEEEQDEGHRAGAQPFLFLHADRGVLRWHDVALPHPQAVILSDLFVFFP